MAAELSDVAAAAAAVPLTSGNSDVNAGFLAMRTCTFE